VIVPTRGESRTLRDTILSLSRTDVAEIIIVSKATIDLNALSPDERVKLVVAPEAGISQARNLGISKSSGEIIAFTDDDCTVPQNWLEQALAMFEDPQVGVVGGPGVTHPDDSLRAKCSGAVLTSKLGTSTSVYRYSAISDHPKSAGEKQLSTCNLFFRKRALEEQGYFHTALQTCEENELIERVRSAGYIVLYVPTCIVFHHRRPLFRPFLEQIWKYGKGRALFTLKWPSLLTPISLVPSLLALLTLLLPAVIIVSMPLARIMLMILALYLVIIVAAAVQSTVRNELMLRFAPIVFLGILAMHYCYGISFIAGLPQAVQARD
jgi:succinoglycan biosynthesis protein ExoA